ncbi:MAG: Rid family hydrolase [Chromatiales bacterium]|nr:Rid family hydrolase [Chromatiales bacterium]
MAGQPVLPKGSPPPLAPYSPGFRSGQFVCTAGMLSMDAAGNVVGAGDVREQTRQVLENIRGVLEAAGGSLEHIVYNMIFLADLGDYQAMNEVYGSYFPENPPTRACVQAGLVKPEFLVEIAATAVIDE